jgi:hypothetical protein
MRAWIVAVAVLSVLLAVWLVPPAPAGAQRRWVVAFANATEEPGVTLEGTGFTGAEIRESFNLAVRQYPIDLVFYDNQRSDARAVANAEAAIARKVDLYIQYHRGAAANATIAPKLKAAGIPILAVNYPVPGAPLYSIDNAAAGRLAGEALAQFATRTWSGQPMVVVVIGRVSDAADRVPERVQGVSETLRQRRRRAAHDARHPGQPRAGRHARWAASRRASRRERSRRRHRRRHRAGGQVRGRVRWPAARHARSSATVSIAASTAARTIARRSIRATAAASSSARSRSTWIGWATKSCRSPSGCSAGSRCRHSPRRRTSSSPPPTCSSSTRPTT